MDANFLKWFMVGTALTALMAAALVKAGQTWG